MKNKWSDDDAAKYLKKYGRQWGEDLALRTYSSRLLGSEKELVLHGGGNCSVKGSFPDILGKTVPVLYVKASGIDLSGIKPDEFSPLKLEYLSELKSLNELSDEELVNQMKIHLFHSEAPVPSFETLVHAFIREKFVDHTHARAILTLSNRKGGKNILRELFQGKLGVVDYAKPGLPLALAVAEAVKQSPDLCGLVLMHHGLITWGKTSRQSFDRTIEMVTLAEKYIDSKIQHRAKMTIPNKLETAGRNYLRMAPVLRGSLAIGSKNEDWPYDRFILKPLISEEVLEFMEMPGAKKLALSAPVTMDYLIRTKPFPLWLDEVDLADDRKARKQIDSAVSAYRKDYQAYFKRNSGRLSYPAAPRDGVPRIIFIRGTGIVCAGKDAAEAEKVRDFTRETLAVKSVIARMGEYDGLSESHLFDMEYSSVQQTKLKREKETRLQRSAAVVTGAAGAIGWGICQGLLEAGCQVAVTDLPGKDLDSCFKKLADKFGPKVMAAAMDVTDSQSVRQGFEKIIAHWGGIDIVIPNAGVAHVSSLAEMDPRNFRKLSQVNIDGTLHVLSEAARLFKSQATGGDIVVISTKNVFAPGARFGAYSATKAAAHQLARIASLELADIGVRVNMVSPDAVFSHDDRKSGLWAEVGPDRMKARGLDEKGLAEYYQGRNLLKAKVTARHVANAVLFFVTHQTPTTGATIPVDGGLPDATPR